MADVLVSPVQTWRDRRQFLALPWEIYRGDPNWVPPLLTRQRGLLGWKPDPFYEHAELQAFLARRGGRPCGRIAAIINHAHNKQHREQRGFFGFFESVDDQEVADVLFDSVRAWCGERGIFDLRGPASPSLMHECGLLIHGFDSPPVFMMSYNPRYYEQLIEGWGFRKTHDLLAYRGRIERMPKVNEWLAPAMQNVQERLGTTVRPLDKRRFQQELERFLGLWNESLYAMWGFVPITRAEVRHNARLLRHLLLPELALIAEVEGRAVGCVMAVPDYNVVLRHLNGRLWPFGWLQILRSRRRIGRIRLLAINVLPEYQRWGLGLVLVGALIPAGERLELQECEYSWVAESNDLSRKTLEKAGVAHYKTYRMYDFPPPAPAKIE